MKGLPDLFSRDPTPVRVTTHVERLLVGQREALDLNAYAERLETLLPSPYHWATDVKLRRNLLNQTTLGCREHDLRALNMLPRPAAISDDRRQHLPTQRTHDHAYCLCHDSRVARQTAAVNRLIGSEH